MWGCCDRLGVGACDRSTCGQFKSDLSVSIVIGCCGVGGRPVVTTARNFCARDLQKAAPAPLFHSLTAGSSTTTLCSGAGSRRNLEASLPRDAQGHATLGLIQPRDAKHECEYEGSMVRGRAAVVGLRRKSRDPAGRITI